MAFKPLTLPCSMPHPATSMPSSLRKGSRTAKKTRRHGHPSHAVPIVGACNDDDVVVACDVCTSCSHWLQPLCDWDDWVAGRMNTYNYFKSNYNITIITHTHIYIYISILWLGRAETCGTFCGFYHGAGGCERASMTFHSSLDLSSVKFLLVIHGSSISYILFPRGCQWIGLREDL